MAYPPRTNAQLEALGAGGHEAHAQDLVDLDANIHTAPQAITATWDFTSTASFVGAYVDVFAFDNLGEVVPNSGVRYTATPLGANHITIIQHGYTDAALSPSGRTVFSIVEATNASSGTTQTTFSVIMPTTGGTGNADDIIGTRPTAAEIVALFNGSVAADRVTASLTPGHDGTGQIDVNTAAQIGRSTITPHIEVRGGVITSPVTIHPDEGQQNPLTLRAADDSPLGTAVLNVEHADGTPNDVNGYGVIHLDSDGGGGFAHDRITWSQNGLLFVDVPPELSGGQPAVRVGANVGLGADWAALSISGRTPEQVGWELYPYTDATADSIVTYDPTDGTTKRFRVTPMGEVHARGGVVLTSPDGTAFRITVANDGTITATPA